MRVLGVIPARGGSKGVPRKNIRPLGGKPLLVWTVEAALAAERLDRVILSTEDEEIADVGRRAGVEAPFLRPAELAGDSVRTIPVLQHAILFLEKQGFWYDAVMTLQPTNPFRRAEDIDGAVELMEKTGCDSVISFTPVGGCHPSRMKQIGPEYRVIDPPFGEPEEGMPRQALPEYFLREGSIYLTKICVLMEQGSLKGSDCRAWLVPPERAINIDTELDFVLAEAILGRGGKSSRGAGDSENSTHN